MCVLAVQGRKRRGTGGPVGRNTHAAPLGCPNRRACVLVHPRQSGVAASGRNLCKIHTRSRFAVCVRAKCTLAVGCVCLLCIVRRPWHQTRHTAAAPPSPPLPRALRSPSISRAFGTPPNALVLPQLTACCVACSTGQSVLSPPILNSHSILCH